MQKQLGQPPQASVFKLGLFTALSALLLVTGVFFSYARVGEAAINEQMQFQARLLTSGGSLVADGDYNVRFRIYTGGDGNLGGGDEVLEWTETWTGGNQITVTNGYVSAQLGSVTAFGTDVDWNSGTLWLSMEIGGTGGSPVWDGEMDPFIRLSSTPYAFNAGQLEGRDADQFVQLDPGASPQTVNSTNTAVNVNQTGTGDLINLQQGGTDYFNVDNSGSVQFGALDCTSNANGGALTADASGNITCSDDDGGAGGGGVTTVGTIDSQSKSADGAVISGSNIYLQSADATYPGLVSTSAQTFAGTKTFNDNIELGVASTTDGSVTFYNSTNGQSVTLDASNQTTGNVTISFPDTGADAADTVCLLDAGNCFGAGSGATLQAAYDAGNTITTTDNRNLAFTLANTTTDSDFIVDIAASSTSVVEFQSNTTALLRVDSSGVDLIDVDVADFTGANVTFDNDEITDAEVSNTLTASNFIGSGSTTNAVDLATAEIAGVLGDANVADTLTIDASSTIADGALSTNVTLAGNTFNGASQLVQLNGTTELPAVSGTNLTNLNASNVSSGTLNDLRLSTNVSLFGSDVETGEIADGTILEADLNVTNAPTDTYLLSANGTGFTWIDPGTVGTQLTESEVEAYIFDGDNVGTLSSGTLALGSLSFTGTLSDTYVADNLTLGTVSGNPVITNGLDIAVAGTGTRIDNASNGATSTTLFIGNESILTSGDIGASVQAYSAATTLLGGDIDLTSEVTGALPIANGGTGATTSQGAIDAISQLTTTGDLLYFDGANSTRLARGGDGDCLSSNATTLVWIACAGAGSGGTLQAAYEAGNVILATDTEGDIDLTVSEATNFSVDVTGTGSFLVQDGGTNVATVADGGAATFQNSVDSANAFRVLTSGGTNLFDVDTTNQLVTIGDSATDAFFTVRSTGGNSSVSVNATGNGGSSGSGNATFFVQADSETESAVTIKGATTNLAGNAGAFQIRTSDNQVVLKAGSNPGGLLALTAYTGQSVNILNATTNGGTQGDILTVAPGGDANFDSNTLFVDASEDRVGIGTNTPGFNLDLFAAEPILNLGHDDVTVLNGDTLGRVDFRTNDTNADDPNEQYAASIRALAEIDFGTANDFRTGLAFYTTLDESDPLERLRINGQGWVGIGTSSPGSKLDVRDGNIEASNSQNSEISLIVNAHNGNGASVIFQRNDVDTFKFYNTDNSNLFLQNSAGDDLVTFTSTGNLVFEGDSADGFETTLEIVDPTADVTFQLPVESAGTYELCSTAGNCAGVAGNSLQQAYNAGNAILATDAEGDIDLTVSEATNFSVDITGTGSFLVQDGGTNVLEVADGTSRLDVTGDLDISGASAFGSGATPNANSVLDINETWTDAGVKYGLEIDLNANSSVAGVNRINSINSFAQISGAEDFSTSAGIYNQIDFYSTGTINSLTGLDTRVYAGGGNPTTLYGTYTYVDNDVGSSTNTYGDYINVRVRNTASTRAVGSYILMQGQSGTLTDVYGQLIEPTGGGGTITSLAGAAIGDQTVGTNNTNLLVGTTTIPSGNYSIYNSSTSQNFFASGLRFGADSTDNLIDDASNGAGSATLYIGNESILTSGDIGSSVQSYDANTSLLGSSIETGEITDGTITGTDIDSGTVTNANLVNSQVAVNTDNGLQGGGNVSLGGSRNLSLGDLTADWVQAGAFDIVLNNAGAGIRILEASGGTYYGEFDVADLNATRLYTFPDADGEVSVLGQTIENGELANASVTVGSGTGLSGGGAVALGGSITLNVNLGDDIVTGEIVDGTILAADLDTTNTLGAGVDGYLYTYNNAAGDFTLIDPATLSGAGVTSLNGLTGALSIAGSSQISVSPSGSTITLAIPDNSLTSTQIGGDAVGASELASSGVTADTYGSASEVPVFAVDEDGRITSVTDTSISIAGSQIGSGTVSDTRLSSNVAFLDQSNTFTAIGTALTVSNNASVVGTLTVGDLSCTDCLEAGNLATGAVATAEILDNTILATDLDYTNGTFGAGQDGYVLTYDNTSGGFTWIDGGTLGSTLSESEVEAYIFDGDNTGTLSSGTLALSSLSYTGNLTVAEGGTGITAAGAAGGVYYSTGSAFANSGAGTSGQCLLSNGAGAPSWGNCGGSGAGAVTLQVAYDNGNSITTTNARDIDFTLANTATDSNFLVDIATSSTSKIAFQSNGTDLLRVDSSGIDLIDVDVADFSGATVTFDAGEIDETEIAQNTLDDSEIATGGIGSDSLATGSVLTDEIADDTILEADLDATNAATDDYVLTFDSGSAGFTWVSQASIAGSAGVSSLNGLSGALSIVGNTQIGVSAGGSNVNLSIQSNSIGNAQLEYDTGQNLTTTSAVTFGDITSNGQLSINRANNQIALVDADTASTEWTIGTESDEDFALYENGVTQRLLLTAAGNLSITGDLTVTGGDLTVGTTNISEADIDALDDGSIDLTSEVNGTLPVANGGTGAINLTNGILLGNGTSAISSTGVLANGQILIGDGTGNPTVATISGGTGISVVNGAGSITINNDFGTDIEGSEIANNTIEEPDLEVTNSPTDGYVLEYDSGTNGFTWVDPSGIGVNETTVESYIFDADNTGTLSSGTLALNSLSYTGQLGVANGGTGLSSAGTAGGVFYSTGTGFANNGAGSSGQCLLSNGAGAPSWGSCGGAGAGATTLQVAYDNGNNITTTDNRNIEFDLADTTTDADFIVDLQGSGSQFEIRDAGVANLIVDGSGNVGIGGAPGAFKLDVTGSARVSDNLTVNGNVTLGDTTSDTITSSGRLYTENGIVNTTAGDPGNIWNQGISYYDGLNVFGTEGSFRGSWAWNGYRRSSDNLLDVIGVNGSDTVNVIEQGDTGIFFRSGDGLSDGDSQVIRQQLQITPAGTFNFGQTSTSTTLNLYDVDDAVSDQIVFYNGSTRVGEIGTEDGTWLRINQETANNIYTPRYFRADAGLYVDSTSFGINGSGRLLSASLSGTYSNNITFSGTTTANTINLSDDNITGIQEIRFNDGGNFSITSNTSGLVFDGGDGTADFLVYDNNIYSDTLRLGYSGTAQILTYDSGEDLTLDTNGAGAINFQTSNVTSLKLFDGGALGHNVDSGTYDVWIQGNLSSTGGGESRNLALLGNATNDDLILNYNKEYDCVSIGGTSCSTWDLVVSGDIGLTGSVFGTNWISGATGFPYTGNSAATQPNTSCRSASTTFGYAHGRCTSLQKYKDFTTDLPYGLDTLRQFRPVQFKWNIGDQQWDTGFIAEEVYAIDPIFAQIDAGELSGVRYRHLTSLITASVQELDLQVQDIDSRLVAVESGMLDSLNVAADALVGQDLTVTGNVDVQGDLAVTGTAEVQDIIVNGKIITAGDTPTIANGTVLGLQDEATIEGNDSAGLVTIEFDAASTPVDGDQAIVTFDEAYDVAPRIALTAKDADSAAVRTYVETTASGFTIYFIDTPTANTTYTFDYIIIQ